MYCDATELHPGFGPRMQRWKRAFEKLGAEIESPSGDGYVLRVSKGQSALCFPSDALPLNSASGHALARDKLATYQLLERHGVRVPAGVGFFAVLSRERSNRVERERLITNLEPAVLGALPGLRADPQTRLIVKPSAESHGIGVRLCRGMEEVQAAAAETLKYGRCGLVQEFVEGPEYRVVLLDGEVLLAYCKRNPILKGDGRSTERELIADFNRSLGAQSGSLDTGNLPPLEAREWQLDRVPEEGEILELGVELQNLCHGSWPELLTAIPDPILEICWRAHRVLGLRYSGIDVRMAPGQPPTVLEVNGNPGYDFLERTQPELVGRVIDKLAFEIARVMTGSGVVAGQSQP